MADDHPDLPRAPSDAAAELAALYETDVLAWSELQAAALRARRAGEVVLDWDNLAEEIEDVGKSQYQSCESQVENIIEHLLKLEWIGSPDDVRGWRKEIRAFRRTLAKRLTPTITQRLKQDLADLHRYARKQVEEEYGALLDAQARSYNWEQIVDEDWFPEPRAN